MAEPILPTDMSVLSGGTYLAVLVLSGAVGVFMAALALRQRESRPALAFGSLMVLLTLWTVTEAVSVATGDLVLARAARATMFVAIPFVPVALLVLAFYYTGREQYVSRTTIALLSLLPTVTVLLVLTNFVHYLVWLPGELVPIGRYSIYVVTPVSWFWVHTAYSYALLLVGSYLFVRGAFSDRGIYRQQSVFIVIGVVVPWAANVFSLFGPLELAVDLTPVLFTISGVFIGVAILRYRFLDLVPVARNNVVEVMREAVMVIDEEGRIVDANPAACEVLGREKDAIVGSQLTDAAPEPLATACLGTAGTTTVSLPDRAGHRTFDLRRSTLPTGGQVVLFYDVTERRAQADRLERQNERLERFASVLSHDLRNPLNVAQGYVELLSEETDSPHTEKVSDALTRMEALIDDTLVLAREGQTVTDPEPVSLAETARTAWENVVTGDARLVVETSSTVQGDPDRLTRLFENLFRNAVEHGASVADSGADGDASGADSGADGNVADGGADALTVTVEGLGNGFAVTDTGPGIPADAVADVFEFGYTTSEEGTGLGLSIVAEIAEAHGWSVTATSGEAGGARFEFTEVGRAVGPAPESAVQPSE